jgi:hypothetical protein
MNKFIIVAFSTLFATTASADDSINTKTNTWKSIPITVDTNNQTYTTAKGGGFNSLMQLPY